MVLATLAAQSLTHQALATSDVKIVDSPQTKQTGDLVVSNSPKESITQEEKLKRASSAIASPESLTQQEFALTASPSSASSSASMSVESSARGRTKPADGDDTGNSGLRPATLTLSSLGAAALTENANTPNVANTSRSQTLIAQLPTLPPPPQPTNDNHTPSAVPASQVTSLETVADLQSHSARDLLPVSTPKQTAESQTTPTPQETITAQQTPAIVAQATPITTTPCPDIDALLSQLSALEDVENVNEFQASPSLSIVIPTGFGADRNTGFISATFQERTRYGDVSDGGLGIGIGLGDARKAVGVELSYAIASFGGSRDFGSGGFNVKLHRQLSDTFAVAAGWNGFLNLGGDNDFENSVYGTATKIFRVREDINSPFSRVAFTAGIGSGQFRTEDDVAEDSEGVNVFGNIAVRVAQPVSLIAEWSGQDLGVGLSIAPFKNIPLVITPALRDIAGAGDGARFVLGTGLAFRF